MQETLVRFLNWEDPLEEGMQPTPVFSGFPGGSDSRESACSAGNLGSTVGWENPLEEDMATHSSILAWRIPTDKRSLAGPQSMGS